MRNEFLIALCWLNCLDFYLEQQGYHVRFYKMVEPEKMIRAYEFLSPFIGNPRDVKERIILKICDDPIGMRYIGYGTMRRDI